MVRKQQSVKINFVMNVILSMSAFIFPLITFPYVSRILLPEGMGKVSFANSLMSYFVMFAQLGIPTYGIRACAKVRDDKIALSRTAQEILIINLAMSVLSYLALFWMLAYVPRLQSEKALYLITSATILLSAIGMDWLYRALEQYTYITMRSLIMKIISVGAMFLLIHEQSDYIVYGAISVLASAASNVFNFVNARRYITLKPLGGYCIKQHIKPILMFFAMACAVTVYTNLDVVMIGFMKTDAEVGYYNASVKIKTVLLSIVTALSSVLLPRASYYVENRQMKEFREIAQKAISFVILVAIPLMTYFAIFAKEGVFFLSGESYANAILPMRILMPTVLLIGVTNVLGIQVLVPLGRESTVLRSEIAGAVVDVIINLALIPRFASVGAAVGTLAAEAAVLVVQYQELKKEMKDVFAKTHIFRIIAATVMASVSAIWVKLLPLGNFITLAISAILFFGVYALYLLRQKEEMIVQIWETILSFARKFFPHPKN